MVFSNGHRYTRIALGKSRAMDVVGGESSGASGQLLLLYPMLLGGCGRGVRMCRGRIQYTSNLLPATLLGPHVAVAEWLWACGALFKRM